MEKLANPDFITENGHMTISEFLERECDEKITEMKKHLEELRIRFMKEGEECLKRVQQRFKEMKEGAEETVAGEALEQQQLVH
ncbi:hypothetical protein AAMO2058_000512800 [Amorphochlora amoebiformis]